MLFLIFGSLILLYGTLATMFSRSGKQMATLFNLSCITLLLYVLQL